MRKYFGWILGLSLILSVVGATPELKAEREGREEDAPRNFVLVFEVVEYHTDLRDAIRYFFENVLRPGDQLIIYTPARVYGFSPEKLTRPRERAEEMQRALRQDVSQAASRYREIIGSMRNDVREIESPLPGDLRNTLVSYRQSMADMRLLRKVNEEFLKNLAGIFSGQSGRHHVILFFQSEFRPIPGRDTLNRLKENPTYAFHVTELFMEDTPRVDIDIDGIGDLYLQNEIRLNFIYFHGRKTRFGDDRKEHSLDVYAVFKDIAGRTGGGVQVAAGSDGALRELAKTF